MCSDVRPTLLVFADSLSYYGPTGGLPADDPRIWPNLVASQLGWDMELIGRIGWTCRDVWWAATPDPRAWAALPRAGAVVFATSGMDSLPSVLPTAVRELIRYVRPPWLRRWARDGYGWLQPRLAARVFVEGTRVANKLLIIDVSRPPSLVHIARLSLTLPFAPFLPVPHDGFISALRAYSPSALRALARYADPAIDVELRGGKTFRPQIVVASRLPSRKKIFGHARQPHLRRVKHQPK